MKKLMGSLFLVGVFFVSLSAQALDPVAPRSERKFGMVYVKSPLPSSDVITLTATKSGKSQTVQSGTDVKVPIGDYNVSVQMQNYVYEQDIVVRPTERHEVIVPGYGNIKVNATTGKVEAYKAGTGSQIAEFGTNEVKTLPRGRYDLVIKLGAVSLNQNNIWVVTNTTRQIDISF